MKKFTKIEEDLETENVKIQAQFKQQYELAEKQIDEIKKMLFQFSVVYYGDPAGRNKEFIDYLKELERLNDELEDIIKYYL